MAMKIKVYFLLCSQSVLFYFVCNGQSQTKEIEDQIHLVENSLSGGIKFEGITGDKLLAFERAAQRRQAIAEGRQALVAILDDFLQRPAKPLLARPPEIVLVLRRRMPADVEHDKPDQCRLQYGLGPVLDKPRQRPPDLAAE